MKQLICIMFLIVMLAGCTAMNPGKTSDKNTNIVHSVFFKLKHEAASNEETDFFTKAAKLAAIPSVKNFQVLKEVSPKNPYTFGLSMEFVTQADYDSYNNHPDHVSFVQNVWMNEVTEFQEIDYVIAE